MKERFTFDGQLHIPPSRIEETASLAIERGLDALVFTNYGNTANFDYLTSNKDNNGQPILTPNKWDIQSRTPSVLELTTDKGNLYVVRGEEVKTRQGHLLVWATQEPIGNGVDISDALTNTYRQGGVAVFSHLLTKLFHGCGEEVFHAMYSQFQGAPLGVEQNGQIPKRWMSDNKRVKQLADKYDVACFGTSDIHGSHRQEHRKVGLRNYSSVPSETIDPEQIGESLRTLMISQPQDIQIEGTTNTLTETVMWNLASLRKNGWKKIADLWNGFKNTRKH